MEEQESPPEGVFQIEVYIHFVFSTKDQQPVLTGHIQDQIWALMGDIARENRIHPIAIGGTEDHVHLLLSLPSTISIEDTVNRIKSGSAAYIHETYPALTPFAWQQNYMALGLSKSDLKPAIAYIKAQPKLHQSQTYPQEFRTLLAQNGIAYEEEGLWD